MKTHRPAFTLLALAPAIWTASLAAAPAALPGDAILQKYFVAETAALSCDLSADVRPHYWTGIADADRSHLKDMLGLEPWMWVQRTDLHPQITGRIEREDFVVEKLHFQSLPGLYVTANFYLPKQVSTPLPTILYVCGHSFQIKDGVSFGNKAGYQRHGVWFAKNGYACLMIDTLQLGEIQGIHHGTYRYGRWWWNSRGYTPAGVETWNGIRALDYLETRPEVDASRIGITGRSGGGAYSWFIAALDQRIKVAAPVAGITDLRNQVVDGMVAEHCDCMFFVNTYRWDYPMLAALVAPRPLLLANSDQDGMFPLDGVLRVYEYLRRFYAAQGASDKLGLLITEGPHKDTQALRVPVFHWFNRWLKGEDPPIVPPALPVFEPAELKVFDALPADERNTSIDETFVPVASLPPAPDDQAAWEQTSDAWLTGLREKVFRGWPAKALPFQPDMAHKVARLGETDLILAEVPVHHTFSLPLILLRQMDFPVGKSATRLVVCREADWQRLVTALRAWLADTPVRPAGRLAELLGAAKPDNDAEVGTAEAAAWLKAHLAAGRTVAFFPPRGIGPTAWSGDAKQQTQIRRRFMMLGQTLDGMRVWDIRQAVRALPKLQYLRDVGITLVASDGPAVNALLAAIFEPRVTGLALTHLPAAYREAPDYLNIARNVPFPGLLALAAEGRPIGLKETPAAIAAYARAVAHRLGWPGIRVE